MKTKNFTGRKDQRRREAIARMKKSGPKPPLYSKDRFEKDLKNTQAKLVDDARDVRSKKCRN